MKILTKYADKKIANKRCHTGSWTEPAIFYESPQVHEEYQGVLKNSTA
jgi:hypothetical protein